MSSEEQLEFLRKPEVDLLSGRSWRRETLVRYSSANQSEPLRLLLWAALGLALLFSRSIAEAVGAPAPEPLAAYYGGAAAALALSNRERQRRTRQLSRLEREHQVANLEVVMAPTPGAQKRSRLRALRNKFRVVAAYAPPEDLARLERARRALARRLEASRVLVVAVPSTGELDRSYSPARPGNLDAWRDAFSDLLTTDAAWAKNFEFETRRAAWFGLGFSGRSAASGTGLPDLLELLGSAYPPRRDPTARPALDATEGPLLRRLGDFYDALLRGTPEDMERIFSAEEASPRLVDEKVDDWAVQLGTSRPVGLAVGDADSVVFDDEAFTTVIEQLPDEDRRRRRQTLLAIQRWVRQSDGDWKLVTHETVPYAPGISAAALLRCDARGCVAFLSTRRN